MENDFKFNNKKQMKKLLLLTMLAIITLPIMSQTHFLNAFELITTDGVNDSRKYVDVGIILNASDKRITIYSNETQIIDYVVNNMYEKDNYSVFEASATDTKYKRINVIISISNNSNNVIITIGYSDFAYSYICKVVTV